VPDGADPVDPTEVEYMDITAPWTRYHGLEPWDRDTAMTLAVEFEGAIPSDSATGTCACDDGAPDDCLGISSVCSTVRELRAYQLLVEEWAPSRGTLAWDFFEDTPLVGFGLHVEVDIERSVARACLVGYEDAYMARPDPQCAVAGAVRLSARPATQAEAETTFMTIEARFDVVELHVGGPVVRNLRFEASTGIAPSQTYPLQ
jgi:hypothetical protein